MEQIITYVIISLIFFLIGVSVTRWIFRIDKFMALQEEQTALLRAIAGKVGAVESTGPLNQSNVKVKQEKNHSAKNPEIISDEDLEREALSYPKD